MQTGRKALGMNFYTVYDYDFDLISEDIGHGQCIREHIDLEAAKIGSILFHEASPYGRRFDQNYRLR